MKFLYIILLAQLVSCSNRTVIVPARVNLDPVPKAVDSTERGDDPLVIKQVNLVTENLKTVWSNYSTSKRVKVAIVGSGIDYNHEDLRENVFINMNEFNQSMTRLDQVENQSDDDGNGYVDDVVGYDFVDGDGFAFEKRNSYGTAAAGVIGAVHNNAKGIKGINANINLIPVRYINQAGSGKATDLLSSIDYAVNVGVDVVFVHLVKFDYDTGGMLGDDFIKAQKKYLGEILSRAHKKDVAIVMSAGSLNYNLSSMQGELVKDLSKSPNVIIATSLNKDNELSLVSNYGVEVVDIASFGDGIFSTAPGNTYKEFRGTYMAAAQVAGALAYAKSLHYGEKNTVELMNSMFQEEATDVIEKLRFLINGSNKLNIKKYLTYLSK